MGAGLEWNEMLINDFDDCRCFNWSVLCRSARIHFRICRDINSRNARHMLSVVPYDRHIACVRGWRRYKLDYLELGVLDVASGAAGRTIFHTRESRVATEKRKYQMDYINSVALSRALSPKTELSFPLFVCVCFSSSTRDVKMMLPLRSNGSGAAIVMRTLPSKPFKMI